MPIGKDSIQKRVAKTVTEEKDEIVTENVTPSSEEKPATAKKPASSTAKKPAVKKPATPKKTASTAVIANISPEVTEKVTGHKEGAPTTIVSINQKLPVHLL